MNITTELSVIAVILFQVLPGISYASGRIELPHPSATPPAASTKDLAEKEVALPAGSAENSGTAVIFPDFSPASSEGGRDSLVSARKSTSRVCRRAGNSYKPGDVMFASCKSQNEGERGQTRSQMGASHGKFSGSNTGAGAGTL